MSDDRPTPRLSIDVLEPDDGSARVVAVGEVDLASAPALVDAVRARLHGRREVQLDLRDVTFLDSSGVHALMQLARADEGEGTLTISRDLRPQVEKVLDVSGVMRILPFDGD